jgi:ornithine carbamoyltransferase
MIAASKTGANISVCAPKKLWPDVGLQSRCAQFAEQSGSVITVTDSAKDAAKDAHVIYTDVWCSMGEESLKKERVQLLEPYRVDGALMELARADAVLMQCLPAVKGDEVTDDVFSRYEDVVFDQAENRMHTIKAVMIATLAAPKGYDNEEFPIWH